MDCSDSFINFCYVRAYQEDGQSWVFGRLGIRNFHRDFSNFNYMVTSTRKSFRSISNFTLVENFYPQPCWTYHLYASRSFCLWSEKITIWNSWFSGIPFTHFKICLWLAHLSRTSWPRSAASLWTHLDCSRMVYIRISLEPSKVFSKSGKCPGRMRPIQALSQNDYL